MEMKKIHFGIFDVNSNYGVSILANLAISYGWDVEANYYEYNISEEEIQEILTNSKPDIVALSFMLFSRQDGFRVAKVAKEMKIKVIVGSSHASSAPYDCFKSGYFDAVVEGDGMGVLENILSNYKSLDGKIIPGIVHPDQSLYLKKWYSEKQKSIIRATRTMEVFTTFGCPYKCNYCHTPDLGKYKKVVIEDVVEQLVADTEEYGLKRLTILDSTFGINVDRLRKFRLLLEERNLNYAYQAITVRADTIAGRGKQADEETFMEEVKLLGIEEFGMGVEVVSDKMLKLVDKNCTTEQEYKALQLCDKYDMRLRASLMVGLPTQDVEDYEETLEFIKNGKPQNVNVSVFLPFPGTKLYDYCFKNNHMPNNFKIDDYFDKPDSSTGNTGEVQFNNKLKTFLRNIDYDMAYSYKKKYEDIVENYNLNKIKNVIGKVDEQKWVLLGSGEYFYKTARKIANINPNNCLGIYDYNTESDQKVPVNFFNIQGDSLINYNDDNGLNMYNFVRGNDMPEVIVLTAHQTGKLYKQLLEPMIRNSLSFSGQIESVAS
jgi:pyruvate-formate lyase-activating enzyme